MNTPTDAPASPRALALARAIRMARGQMPQMEFVKHAHRTQSVVSNWENGKQTPTLDALCALEESLGLPLGTLAARAGYFTAEAIAANISSEPISSRHFDRRSDALRAVRAADFLGFGVRLSSTRACSDEGSQWVVDILAGRRHEHQP